MQSGVRTTNIDVKLSQRAGLTRRRFVTYVTALAGAFSNARHVRLPVRFRARGPHRRGPPRNCNPLLRATVTIPATAGDGNGSASTGCRIPLRWKPCPIDGRSKRSRPEEPATKTRRRRPTRPIRIDGDRESLHRPGISSSRMPSRSTTRRPRMPGAGRAQSVRRFCPVTRARPLPAAAVRTPLPGPPALRLPRESPGAQTAATALASRMAACVSSIGGREIQPPTRRSRPSRRSYFSARQTDAPYRSKIISPTRIRTVQNCSDAVRLAERPGASTKRGSGLA
jgi:hypothetical protein